MLTIKQIEAAAKTAAAEFPISKITLFGSYANGTNTEESDVDLLVEFTAGSKVTLLTVAAVKYRFEELLGAGVDVVHAPVPKESILEIDKVVSLYAA